MGIKMAIDLGLTVPIVAGGISSPATLPYCGRRHRICLILLGMLTSVIFRSGALLQSRIRCQARWWLSGTSTVRTPATSEVWSI
jgi:hypothetical protein